MCEDKKGEYHMRIQLQLSTKNANKAGVCEMHSSDTTLVLA